MSIPHPRGLVGSDSYTRPAGVRKVVCSEGVHILVPESANIADENVRLLGRLHCTLGHPDERALSRLLQAQHVP
eukprot:3159906-Amphidinium_carterae.1